MQLELFTTFNNHFVYNDDIDALGWGSYIKRREEHIDTQLEDTMYMNHGDDSYETCFECGLSYSDTIEYERHENEH